MTRTADITVPLEARIKGIRRVANADLFISIHANSASNKNASGIETFCLKPSLFCASGFTDARYRCVANKYRLSQYEKSKLLADLLQKNTIAHAKKMNHSVADRGTKYAVARMLLGADLPGALIEVGFLTHNKEGALLQNTNYQAALAQGIGNSVVDYFKKG